MQIMEFFPLMHIWFFHHSHLFCLKNWFMKCMVKLDTVSVEILTNTICSTYIPKNTCAYFDTCCFRKPFTKYMFLKIVKIDMKTTEPEFLFHNVAGLQPAALLKNIIRLRCFPVNFHKFLKTVFHRTPLGECFLKFYLRFIMACKWRITGQWRIVIHK